jgi:hypothetical protein
MGADVADKLMIDDKHIGIKFSFLKDYNDPYEFFLTIQYNRKPEELAFYLEMIDMVLEEPATCFTKSPVITPMWAHYANNSAGFSIEINEEKLLEHINKNGFKDGFSIQDVRYKDEPDDVEDLLARAYHICKPRYIYFLQSYIRQAAYLTKQTCWSYEQERRLIIDKGALKKINDWLMLLPVPINCISAVIVGKNASESLKESIFELSKKAKCKYFEVVFGRSTTNPFLLTKKSETYAFNNGKIESVKQCCKKCHEPIYLKSRVKKYCGWCSITDKHRKNAAFRNSFRMLESAGILPQYIAAQNAVGSNNKPDNS